MDNVVKGQLGKRIAELRKQSGMTQREMAERLQVTTSALCKWERGQNYPDVEMIARMADLFRVSCDDLINGNIECEEERGVLSEDDGRQSPLEQNKHEGERLIQEELEGQKVSKEGKKIRSGKRLLIAGIVFAIAAFLGIWMYCQKNTGFRIVSERYTDDEMYGEIYEMAIVCPHDYTVDEIKGYSEQVHKKWEQGELGDFEVEVLKLAFYEGYKQAASWEDTEPEVYLFKFWE